MTIRKIKLNLGCGRKKIKGYIGIDNIKTSSVDIVHNLNRFPYPFKKNTVDEILMDNVLEHLDNVVKVLEELDRILASNGKIIILVPYAKSDWSFVDPTHKHFFTEHSLDYFSEDFEYSYYSKVKFKIKYRFINNNSTLKHRIRNMLPLKNILRYYLMNIYDELEFTLTKANAK